MLFLKTKCGNIANCKGSLAINDYTTRHCNLKSVHTQLYPAKPVFTHPIQDYTRVQNTPLNCIQVMKCDKICIYSTLWDESLKESGFSSFYDLSLADVKDLLSELGTCKSPSFWKACGHS